MTMPDHDFHHRGPPPDGEADGAARQAEVALIARLRAGDEDAFAEVVHLFIRPMVRFAYSLVPSWEAAEDVVQTVFAELWEARATMDLPRNLQAFLYGLVRYRALDERRRLGVRARHQDKVQANIESDLTPVTVKSPEDQVLDRTTLEAVVWRLSDQRRHALRLRFLDQLTHEEIGEVLGISSEAAKKLVLRALEDLRKILGVSR